MSTPPRPSAREDFCYRHPRRRSFVLCQRCGRTICPECQTQAAVGVICPECMKDDRRSAPRTRRRLRLPGSVTVSLIVVCTVIYALQWLFESVGNTWIVQTFAYSPLFTDMQHGVFEPWRMLTAAFLHGSWLHLLTNMLTLWVFGQALEPLLGRARFLTLYLVSALGGSLAVALLAPGSVVVGASGAIFGLFGAWLVVLRRTRSSVQSMIILIVINLGVGMLVQGVSWQAHLGGLITGVAAAAMTLNDLDRADARSRTRRVLGEIGMIALAVLCVAVPPVIGILRG